MRKRIGLPTLLAILFTTAAFAQMSGGKPSPAASATCDLGGGKTIKTDYSSPRLRGRKMIGEHEPYGQVWRNGANEATTFVTNADLVVGGKSVAAGSYTLFVVPNPDKWTLIINKKTGEWGIPYKYESEELVRVDMTLSKLPSPVENFTIAYDKTVSGCTLREEWDTTRATVDFSAK